MTLSPKTQAFAFAGALLLVATAMVGTAIATTGTTLAPFARGESYAQERPLTRGEYSALGIGVGQIVDGQLGPAQGALVTVKRPGEDQPVTSKLTNDRGIAVFELRPGAYDVQVEVGNLSAQDRVVLDRSMRVGLFFDEEGTAHWREAPHGELERRGEHAGLVVRVAKHDGERLAPVEGAIIRVYIEADGERELVEERVTGPRGFTAFQLPQRDYVIEVQVGEDVGEQPLELRSGTLLGVLVDDGEFTWRTGHMEPGPAPPPGERPSRTPPIEREPTRTA